MRMMTVHKAKGLEFPVVILADPTCPAAGTKPSRHVVPARNRSAAARQLSCWRLPERSFSATTQRPYGLCMWQRPERGISSSCRLSETNHKKAGSRCSTLPSIRRKMPGAVRVQLQGAPLLVMTVCVIAALKACLLLADRSGQACTNQLPTDLRSCGGTRRC